MKDNDFRNNRGVSKSENIDQLIRKMQEENIALKKLLENIEKDQKKMTTNFNKNIK